MNHRRLSHMFILTIIALLLFACDAPAATPTPVPPTATSVSPTAISVLPTPVFGMNEPVEGGEWRITVLSAENKDTRFERAGQTFRTDIPNTYLLFVQIKLENLNGSPVELAYLNQNIVVRDSVGNTYSWWLAGPAPVFYYDATKEEGERSESVLVIADPEAPSDYIFIIPDNVTTMDLIWSDLPPVRLEVK